MGFRMLGKIIHTARSIRSPNSSLEALWAWSGRQARTGGSMAPARTRICLGYSILLLNVSLRCSPARSSGNSSSGPRALVLTRLGWIDPAMLVVLLFAISCAKVGEWKVALDLLAQLRAGVPSGDGKGVLTADAVSFNAAINALGRGGQWKLALALLREMKESGGPLEVKFGKYILRSRVVDLLVLQPTLTSVSRSCKCSHQPPQVEDGMEACR